MTLDLAAGLLLVLFAVLGARSGALRQLVNLAAAVLGFLGARLAGPPVAQGLGRWLPAPVAHALALVVLFFGIFALAGGAGQLLLRAAGPAGRTAYPWDRAAGALLGGAKAALGIWAALSALVAVDRPFGPSWLRIDPRRSDFAAVARAHNLLDRLEGPGAAALRGLLLVARDPVAAGRLLADADTRALLEDPRVQELLEEARAPGGPEAAAGSSAAARLLADPDFRERLEKAQRRIDALGRAP